MSKIYKDDVGTILQVAVGVDISAATTTDLKVRKPDGTIATWVGAANGTTVTQLDYTIVTDDLDQVGIYRLQSYVVTAAGTFRGEVTQFTVHEAFG